MKRLISFSLVVLIAFCLLLGSERRAWGYVDPGSGLLLLQNVGAVVTGLLFFFRRRIKALFTRKNHEEKTS